MPHIQVGYEAGEREHWEAGQGDADKVSKHYVMGLTTWERD